MAMTLIILGSGVLILAAWGFFELHRMARDDELVTELTEKQADRRLDEIVRRLEK